MSKREGQPGIRSSSGFISLVCYINYDNGDNNGSDGDDGSDGGDGNDDDKFSRLYGPCNRGNLERSST